MEPFSLPVHLKLWSGSKTMVVRPPAHNSRSNMARQKTSIIPVLLHWLIVSVKPPESSQQQEKMALHNGGRSFTLGVMQTKARMAALFGNWEMNFLKHLIRQIWVILNCMQLPLPKKTMAIGGWMRIRESGAFPTLLSERCSPIRFTMKMETSGVFSRTSWMRKLATWSLAMNPIR